MINVVNHIYCPYADCMGNNRGLCMGGPYGTVPKIEKLGEGLIKCNSYMPEKFEEEMI
jgi:hypothetical protein